MPTSVAAFDLVVQSSPQAIQQLNKLAGDALQTRGGRAGSGLGSLLEALWGFMVNAELRESAPNEGIELAWFPDHAYNDFACVLAAEAWDHRTKAGELFRIEAKSMYRAADESKGHFDALQSELGEHDLLVVLVWDWVGLSGPTPHPRVAPQILSSFTGRALDIAKFRDALHVARGGSFVVAPCPDGCANPCRHLGEPLNEQGKRERKTGPDTRKPGKISHAANFGGLVRMMKTGSDPARRIFRAGRAASNVVHEFVSFMHSSFPREEVSQYLVPDWRQCGTVLGVPGAATLPRDELIQAIRLHSNYQEVLRQIS